MRVACILITHLRAKAEMRRQPHLQDTPALIVARGLGLRPLVVDYFPCASGVQAGMTLEQAVANCEERGGRGEEGEKPIHASGLAASEGPEQGQSERAQTILLNADEPYYRRFFGQVLASLQGISDRVESTELGIAYVRLDGMEALFRGEARLIAALLDAIPADLNPRIGVANAKFPAFVAARTRAPGASSAPEDAPAFLAPYSIDLLPVSAAVKTRLHRFGLHRMGDVAAMQRHLIIAQFGHEGSMLWELCNGIDDSPVVPLTFEEPIVECASLPFNSSSIELLYVAVDALLRRGYARPEMAGRFAGVAALQCTAPASWGMSIAFKQPVGHWERAAAIVRSRLDLEPPQIPIEDITLTLSNFTEASEGQMALFQDAREDSHRRLVEMERRLQLRMNGEHLLHRIREVAPWHPAPEMRALQIPIDPSKSDAIKPLHAPTVVEVREGVDSAPVAVRLKRRWRRVARIADRWTFDLWWLPQPITRVYYCIVSDDGQLTLFKDQRDGVWYRQGGGLGVSEEE